ncbi:spermatogenesis-associated protein 7 homolog [Xenopus laevis]|uniref:Spermatogenesis-associated protein 7 homolog n=1 Tax=Xenopus laevis TaxID=8355 RepID=A0A8J1KQ31_XENLA|nr:spermatogenesis-associated protein 7 homolog [Xenopus laevis]
MGSQVSPEIIIRLQRLDYGSCWMIRSSYYSVTNTIYAEDTLPETLARLDGYLFLFKNKRADMATKSVQDQQKKEKLMKAVDMYKKEIQRSFSPAYCESKSHFLEQRKEISINRNNQEFHQIREKVPFSQPAQHVHEERRGAQVKSPVLIARDTMRRIEQEGHCQGEMVTIQTRRSQTRHGNETPRKKAYQDPEKKAYSGDILDKHAAWFTSTKLCFKPRLLKKSAQSFLSNSRHYKSPKKTNAAPQPRSDHHGAEHLGEVER